MTDQDKIILEAFQRIMPFLAESFRDIVITLSDKEKYVFYKAGEKLDHRIKPGDPVREGSMTHRAYKHKGFLMADIGAEVFGMPYSAMGFPIFNSNREIIGGMVFCESVETMENKRQLKILSQSLSRNMALMCNNLDSLVAKPDDINVKSKDLLVQAKGLNESSKAIEDLVDTLIKNGR